MRLSSNSGLGAGTHVSDVTLDPSSAARGRGAVGGCIPPEPTSQIYIDHCGPFVRAITRVSAMLPGAVCTRRSRRPRAEWKLIRRAATLAQKSAEKPLITTAAAGQPGAQPAVQRATPAALASTTTAIAPRLALRMRAIRHAKLDVALRKPPAALQVTLLQPSEESTRQVAEHLAKHGYCICKGGLQPEIVANACREGRSLYESRKFQPGTFTMHGKTVSGADKLNRDDHILWLHKHLADTGGAGAEAVPTIAALDRALHRFGFRVIGELSKLVAEEEAEERKLQPVAGSASERTRFARFDDGSALHCTGRSDMMVSCYDGKRAAYGAHIDSVDGDGRAETPGDHGRCFTCVYYLNAVNGWDESKGGGALRLFKPPHDVEGGEATAENEAVDVYPHGDTFVIFRADRVVHEVCPAHHSRMAASVWFYGGHAEQRKAALKRGAAQDGV